DDESLGSQGPMASLKMTARQKAIAAGEEVELSLDLLDRPSKKKHRTAEEVALRKSETARRRKNQADRKAEEDQQATIEKLLKKQASKRRNKEEDVLPIPQTLLGLGLRPGCAATAASGFWETFNSAFFTRFVTSETTRLDARKSDGEIGEQGKLNPAILDQTNRRPPDRRQIAGNNPYVKAKEASSV
ncbi:hypothetical protein BDK51DRAFT_32311, partial [Blyttiomyces helicus]